MSFTVTSQLTSAPGRFLLQARQQHLVVDSSTERGGAGEAWQAAELLLGALITCSNAVITEQARNSEQALPDLQITASCEADKDNPGHYLYIRLDYLFSGVELSTAQHWVDAFTNICPIYGSLSRGAPVQITVHTQP